MQYDHSGPSEGASARRDAERPAIAATDELSIAAELVGERKRVLDLGCGEGLLARSLGRRECDIVGFDLNPAAVEEARKYCTHAGVADLDGASLPELLGEQKFDVVVLGDVLPFLRQPIRLLDSAREVLAEGGYVVATVPNVSHGAVRLSLLDGRFDPNEAGDQGLQRYTAKTLDELFVSAGYQMEPLRRLKKAIFLPSGELRREDFDPGVVAEVERDAESATRSFAIRAFPLSNDGKQRAIAKRFITVNTELTTLATRLEKRELELERVTAAARTRESELGEARALLNATADEMQRARAALAEVANASRSGAAIVSRAAELEARAKTAEAHVSVLVERAHRAEIEVARLSERLAARGASDPIARAEVDRAIAQRDEAVAKLEGAQQQAAAEHARLTADFNASLGKIRQQSTEAEYGYAERVAELETTLAERQTQLEAAEASNSAHLAIQAIADPANTNALHKAGTEIAAMRNALAERQTQVDAAAKSLALARSEAAETRADYEALQIRFATLQAERDEANQALRAAREENGKLREEHALFRAELSSERLRSETFFNERDAANDELRAAREELVSLNEEKHQLGALLEELRAVLATRASDEDEYRSLVLIADDDIATLRRQLRAVQSHLADEEARAEAATAELASEREGIAVLRLENAALRADLETAIERTAQLETSRLELEAAIQLSRGEGEALRLRADAASKRINEIEARFLDQTQALIDQTRTESERTALLIDTVQGSSFWRLKRAFGWLRRLA